ncbi:putative bicarbonate transporter, IctB family [filamentous cyanobacterium CCP5]|nr:putative bicarbonate transporter, IctB family [filamentous cyanobacterium CCP5]
MMSALWQQVTLARVGFYRWREVSLLHRLLGPLRSWRQGSWLLSQDWIGLALGLLVFVLAPFVSTTLIGVLLLACAAFWVLLTVSDEAGSGFTPIHAVVLVYGAVMAIATALSPVKAAALQGLIKLSLNICLFFLMARSLRRPQARNVAVLVLLLVSIPVSVYGLRQYFFGAVALATWTDQTSTLADATRVYSFLGNPNLLAGYLIPMVAFSGAAVFAWSRWVPKLLAVLLLLVNGLCLVLTLSRGGWIGLLAASFSGLILLVHYLSVRFSPFWRRWALPVLLGGGILLVGLAIATVEPLRLRALSIFAGREDSSNNFRMNVWAGVIAMIKARPILGIGPGNDAFNSIYPLFQRPRFTALSAYSVFLEVTVEAGIIGLLTFLWLMSVVWSEGWRQLQRLRDLQSPQGYWLMAAIVSQVGMLTHGLVDTVWYRPQISTLWWLIMAIVASYYSFERGQRRLAE